MGGRGNSSGGLSRRGSEFGPNINKVTSVDESKYTGYARELAEEANEAASFGEQDEMLLQLDNGRGEAFAFYDEDSGTISGLGSTGGRAGTELLSAIIQTETAKGKSVSWMADNKNAIKYYISMGLQSFGVANNNMTKIVYTITPERAPRALERLRRRK